MKFREIVLFILFPVSVGIALGAYVALERGIPSVDELKNYRKTPGTKIYSEDDRLIGEIKLDKGIYVPVSQMPGHMLNAVISVEDSRFWSHSGVDYIGIARAAYKDIRAGKIVEGGSTITQQLAKITFLTRDKTIKRKINEALLAIKIEKELTKEQILDIYLNRVYFGQGAYGVEMAARTYFGKNASELRIHESAMLAGLLKAPSRYSPYKNFDLARERQKIALLRMEAEGYIDPTERVRLERRPIRLSTKSDKLDTFNYFVEYIKKQLLEDFDDEALHKGGLRVYTTVGGGMQLEAQRALRQGLRELDKRRGWRGPVARLESPEEVKGEETLQSLLDEKILIEGEILQAVVTSVDKKQALLEADGAQGTLPLKNATWASRLYDTKTGKSETLKAFTLKSILTKGDVIYVKVESAGPEGAVFSLEQDPIAEGSLVALDPVTGYLRAMVGGFDYKKSQFNRAVSAERQPGSAFKPFVYAAALDNGFTPASIVVDEPVSYPGGDDGGKWSPKNYDDKYYGPMLLRKALAYSRNVVTVKVLDEIGVDRVTTLARQLDMADTLPRNLSIALGSEVLKPLDLCYGYSVFANGGKKVKRIFIKYITDSKGAVIMSNEPESSVVLSEETAFLINSMMQDVVKTGTGWRARSLGVPVAGKTGTTNDFKDAWFIGFTSEMLTCVWTGMDDNTTLGREETGSRSAAPIWVDFMKEVTTEAASRDFPVPDGIVSFYVDPDTGYVVGEEPGYSHAKFYKEYFKKGTEPRRKPDPVEPIWEGFVTTPFPYNR